MLYLLCLRVYFGNCSCDYDELSYLIIVVIKPNLVERMTHLDQPGV
jgi:hypothetical protein